MALSAKKVPDSCCRDQFHFKHFDDSVWLTEKRNVSIQYK